MKNEIKLFFIYNNKLKTSLIMNFGKTKLNYLHLILFIVIAIGIILRFYDFFNIPYTHDEFGAVSRANVKSFATLINVGVMPDGHPAGIEVFLYLWVKIVGTSAPWIKLPFLLCGIASIYLVWLIGKKWFNTSVGLIAASFVSYLQFTVMYSQMARPYVSGLFFVLLMVNAWTNIIFNPEKNFLKNLIVFILAAALCAYNHHFSLLQAIIVSFTGLFFCKKEYLKYYILAGILIFLLYVPHLKIFFFQLSNKGVGGWLGKPTKYFILQYLLFIFQFSKYVIFAVIIIAIFALKYGWDKFFYRNKFFIISCLWFILPFLIGFFYSRFVDPVLEYSVLIFSLPFLLLAAFSYVNLRGSLQNYFVSILIALAVIPSLVFERQHYSIFYKSIWEDSFLRMKKFTKEKKCENCSIIIDSWHSINKYYQSVDKFPSCKFTCLDSLNNLKLLNNYLDSIKTDYLLYEATSGSPNVNVLLINKYFPFLNYYKYYFGGFLYFFSRTDSTNLSDVIFTTGNSFEDTVQVDNWKSIDINRRVDTSASDGKYSYLIDSKIEFGPAYTIPLKNLITNKNNIIDASVMIRPLKDNANIALVISLEENGISICWISACLKDYIFSIKKWYSLFYSLKLADVKTTKNTELKIYIWNKDKTKFLVDDMKVQVRYGNPILYGLIEKTFPDFTARRKSR